MGAEVGGFDGDGARGVVRCVEGVEVGVDA